MLYNDLAKYEDSLCHLKKQEEKAVTHLVNDCKQLGEQWNGVTKKLEIVQNRVHREDSFRFSGLLGILFLILSILLALDLANLVMNNQPIMYD